MCEVFLRNRTCFIYKETDEEYLEMKRLIKMDPTEPIYRRAASILQVLIRSSYGLFVLTLVARNGFENT